MFISSSHSKQEGKVFKTSDMVLLHCTILYAIDSCTQILITINPNSEVPVAAS